MKLDTEHLQKIAELTGQSRTAVSRVGDWPEEIVGGLISGDATAEYRIHSIEEAIKLIDACPPPKRKKKAKPSELFELASTLIEKAGGVESARRFLDAAALLEEEE